MRNVWAILLLSFFLASCKDKYKESEKKPLLKEPTPSQQFEVMGNLLKGALEKPGPYDERRASDDYKDDEPALAILGLSGSIIEVEGGGEGMFGSGGLPLLRVFNRFQQLAKDENVKAIVLRVGGVGLNMAQAEELHALMLETRAKKPIHCHTEGVSTLTYYLLSACSKINLAPSGGIDLAGFAATPIHLKPLMSRYGVHADMVHIGAFKGAAEPLTRDAPSPEMITTINHILDEAFKTLTEGVSKGRSLKPQQVASFVDTALFTDQQAIDNKLVDSIATYPEFLASLKTPWKKRDWKKDGKSGDDWAAILGLGASGPPAEDHVALIYAVGNIVDGRGQGPLGSRSEIASGVLVPAIHAVTDDKAAKAVVIRVDSGGGSALASEQIWKAVKDLAAKKPTIISMGGAAASGGYYISAPGTTIFADRNTITGSIGVVGGKISYGDALSDIGIKSYSIKRGANADMWSPLQKWTPKQKATVRQLMADIYKVFKNRVSTSRKIELGKLEQIAQGRVWTGAAGVQNKLVDQIGGLRAALAKARELGKLKEDSPLGTYPPEPTIIELLRSLSSGEVDFSVSMHTEILAKLGSGRQFVEGLLAKVRSFENTTIQTVFMPNLVIRSHAGNR